MKRNLLFIILFFLSGAVFGQKIPFQGKLIESGVPVTGSHLFVFEIASVGWSETHASVAVTDGLYFVVLGSINPLPDSLFYGVDEQSMAISVDGTALSPVTLFKPLSSPFEGGELVVHNDEGTKVGEMKAANYSYGKNGEIKVYGTNGYENVTLEGYSRYDVPGNNFGWIDISNDVGKSKVNLLVTPYRGVHGSGEFHLFGDTLASINSGFNAFDGQWDYPYFSFNAPTGLRANIDVVKSDTVERGRLYVSSNINEAISFQPHGWFAYKDGIHTGQFQSQDWGGRGVAGNIQLNGPNSRNFDLSNKHWVNADLPWFKMSGSQSQDVVQISVSDDSTESAYMNLFSNDNKEASFYTTGIRFNTTGDNGSELASINVENRDNSGYAGYLNLNGPNSGNIGMGSRHWEGKADLPLINLYGENYFHGMELSIVPDGNGDQYGFINLMSENGKNLYLSPTGLGIDKISLNTVTENGGSNGEIYLWGDSGSPNIQMGGKSWENHDLGFFAVFTDKPDGNGWYYGAAGIEAYTDGTDSWGSMGLYNNGEERINLDGHSGTISLVSENGKSLNLSPDGFGVQGVSISTTVNQNGNFGSLFLDGPNSRNITLMPDWWDKPDMGLLEISGTSQGRVDIEVNDDGNGQYGLMHLYSDYQKSIRMEPTSIALRDDANGYAYLASISTNNDNGSWVGTVDVYGPNSQNVHIGSQQNTDLPWISLQGTDGFEAMQIGAIDDATQRGFIKMVNKQSGEEMFYSSHGVGGNTAFQVSGGLTVNGFITLNGDTIYPGVSDRRYKTNIRSLGNNVLEKVELVRGVSYDWRKDEFPEKHFTSAKQIGVIAQELEAQFPELVKTNTEGYKSVNYDGLSAVLIEAVKELNAKVEKLEAENTQLKAELSASASNKTEIDQLKLQMKSLLKTINGQTGEQVVTAEFTSTTELK